MIEPRQRLILTYPKSTIVEEKSQFVRRKLIVQSVRDLVQKPLTIREFQRRPLTHRGRLIVRAWDQTVREYRQFYLSSSKEFQAETMLRLAVYVPGRPMPVDVLSRGYGPTKQERILLARRIGRYLDKNLHGLELGIFADELKVS